MDEKEKTFDSRGFVSTAIREIQRLLSNDESVIIWKDEWQFNKDGNMPTANLNKRRTLREGVYLSPEECENLEDALQEWEDVVGCKDCEMLREEEGYDPEIEQKSIGLDYERYSDLMGKLRKCINAH